MAAHNITYSSGLIETDNAERAEKVAESYSEHAVGGSERSEARDSHLAGERLLRPQSCWSAPRERRDTYSWWWSLTGPTWWCSGAGTHPGPGSVSPA